VPGAGSGLGEDGGVDPGSGPGSWAGAGAHQTAAAQQTRKTDACRSNDRPERVKMRSPGWDYSL